MTPNQPIHTLNCPVCGCLNIRTSHCPNCETDLSSLWLLKSLPVVPPPRRLEWLGGGMVVGIVLGVVLGWLMRGWL